MKKSILTFIGLPAILLTLAGCGNSAANLESSTTNSSSASEDAGSNGENGLFVLSTFGLSQDIVEKDITTPFGDNNNYEVVLEVGNAAERLSKVESGASTAIDAIELSQLQADQGASAELFDTVTEEQVPNIANLSEGAMEVYENGAGIPYTVNSIGIVYDPEAIGHDIEEWAELWDAEYANAISIPDISTTFGPAMLHLASDYKDVDITSDNGAVAFEALNELSPNVVKTYEKSSDLVNMFQAGEIEVAVVADFAYDLIKESNPNVAYVVPESGTYANYNTINIPTTAQNKEAAYDYIDWRISQELQATTAASLNEAPVNATVELSEEDAANKTYGEVADRAQTIDTKFVNAQMADWLTKWNETLNK